MGDVHAADEIVSDADKRDYRYQGPLTDPKEGIQEVRGSILICRIGSLGRLRQQVLEHFLQLEYGLFGEETDQGG